MAETPASPIAVQRREFEAEGVAWTAEITGRGAAGGPFSAGILESVYFREAGAAADAARLLYLPAGRLADLMDDELRDLLRSAPPLAERPRPGGEDRERAADRSDHAIEDYRGGGDA